MPIEFLTLMRNAVVNRRRTPVGRSVCICESRGPKGNDGAQFNSFAVARMPHAPCIGAESQGVLGAGGLPFAEAHNRLSSKRVRLGFSAA